VRIPITQIITLLTAAMIQPCHSFFPISTVESTVNTQDM